MLILFVVLLALSLSAAIYGWSHTSDDGQTEYAHQAACAVIGSFAFLILLGASFGGPLGDDTTIHPPVWTTERTSYRIIATAEGLERTYLDAYTVAHADHIKSVSVVVPHNVWGIELTSKRHLELVIDNPTTPTP